MKAPWERLNIALKHADFGVNTSILKNASLYLHAHTHAQKAALQSKDKLKPKLICAHRQANEISIQIFWGEIGRLNEWQGENRIGLKLSWCSSEFQAEENWTLNFIILKSLLICWNVHAFIRGGN